MTAMKLHRCTALVLPLLAAWLPSAHAAAENRTVAEFQAVALSGPMDLVVRQGAMQTLQVQADDKLLPQIETVVENGKHGATLQVRFKPGLHWYSSGKVRVDVVVPRLSAVLAAGSGDIRVDGFNTPALQVVLSGSGDAHLDGLSTDALEVRVSGSGDVAGSGRAARVKLSIAGSGDVRLAELQAQDVQVTVAGSGDAAVNAQKTLDVRIAGSGDVSYVGNASVKSSIAGSGSVHRKP
jgi:hypothetical protein